MQEAGGSMTKEGSEEERKIRGSGGLLIRMTIYTMRIVRIGRNNVGGKAQGHHPTMANLCVHTHTLRLRGCGLAAADRDATLATECVLGDHCLVRVCCERCGSGLSVQGQANDSQTRNYIE